MEVKPGYKQTEVGVIPEDWDVQNGEQITILIGKGGSPRWQGFEYSNTGMLFVTSENVRDGFLDIREPKYLPLAFHEKLKRTKLQKHDILVNLVGASIGRSCQIQQELGEANVNQAVAVFRVKDEHSSAFLACCFQAPTTIERILEMQVDAARPNISLGDLRRFPIQLPPLPEQRAIATALSDVDALLGGLDRLIAKKHDLKQAAMQQLLTGQTRLPGFHAEWEVKRLGDVADMGSGGTPPSSVPDFYDGDIPWASISDMTKGGKSILSTDRNLTRAGFANSAAQMFPAGTILYAMYASLGECSIAGISLCSSQAILGIRPKNKLSGEYLYYFLTSLKGIVKTLGQQGTQANLNKGMVQDFRLSLPPLPEQTAIADVMTEMDGELAGLTQRREKTRALKQAMMQELLTGKTRLI